ncbi:HK97 gp10 family phage protein [Candidimonas humi]|uniref:HK97 gp10 family phage protein n=1 Tax=Candidimonas humi TaxID=683355 RepID=A0ABV8NUK2_9BURK|nr:HK97 gp10 family phage protein [Candidimonas humi]MBV6304935.1 HK97 gp10 family phage protein [Candidimonas humi]
MDAGLEIDISGALAGLDALGKAAVEHLPRSMAVAGGKVLRDEAKARAPVYDGSTALKGGDTVKRVPGAAILRNAIYLAYSESRSNPANGIATYSVSWNAAKAPHGHLLEFGHWWTNVIRNGYPLREAMPTAKWVPAHPTLRPTITAKGHESVQVALERGRVRFAEIKANPAALDTYDVN